MAPNTQSGMVEQFFNFIPEDRRTPRGIPVLPPDAPIYRGVADGRVDEWSADASPLLGRDAIAPERRPMNAAERLRDARRSA